MKGFWEQLKYFPPSPILPKTLKDYFNAIKNLDDRVINKLNEIDTETAKFLVQNENNAKNNIQINPQSQVDFRDKMTTLFEQARISSDDKINFANKSYEEVDKYIRMLDRDLPMFESALKARAKNSKLNVNFDEILEDDKNKCQNGGYKSLLNIFPELAEDGKSRKDYDDIPIDPNEPTYCYCKQICYGEMIACDSKECDIEWFHFGCVNLTSAPKDKWYCPTCKPKYLEKKLERSKKSSSKRKSGIYR